MDCLRTTTIHSQHKSQSSNKKSTSHNHTCQPSRSGRDSPDLETETRRPARRPKKTDSSRFVPINAPNTILNLPFACSVCSSVGIQVSSVSFGLFSCTRPWWADIQQKICIYQGIILFILLSFSSERKKLCIYFYIGLFFLAVKCVESLTKILKNANLTV